MRRLGAHTAVRGEVGVVCGGGGGGVQAVVGRAAGEGGRAQAGRVNVLQRLHALLVQDAHQDALEGAVLHELHLSRVTGDALHRVHREDGHGGLAIPFVLRHADGLGLGVVRPRQVVRAVLDQGAVVVRHGHGPGPLQALRVELELARPAVLALVRGRGRGGGADDGELRQMVGVADDAAVEDAANLEALGAVRLVDRVIVHAVRVHRGQLRRQRRQLGGVERAVVHADVLHEPDEELRVGVGGADVQGVGGGLDGALPGAVDVALRLAVDQEVGHVLRGVVDEGDVVPLAHLRLLRVEVPLRGGAGEPKAGAQQLAAILRSCADLEAAGVPIPVADEAHVPGRGRPLE
mmetsp:Transcript_34481/g.57530  ORF Transcript_34481/g.57530 Transcript_34481/m.57530 type:complete len:349 (+) Transcript_34481:1868-2914(+)